MDAPVAQVRQRGAQPGGLKFSQISDMPAMISAMRNLAGLLVRRLSRANRRIDLLSSH